MNFHSKQKWQQVGSSDAYCTNIPKSDVYAVAVNDSVAPFANLQGAWTVTVNSYVPGTDAGKMSREGVQLTASQKSCDARDASSMSLTLTALHSKTPLSGSSGFYSYEGPKSKGWGSNRRFRDDAKYTDYDCGADRDFCERIGFVTANGVTKACNEADCTIYIERVPPQ